MILTCPYCGANLVVEDQQVDSIPFLAVRCSKCDEASTVDHREDGEVQLMREGDRT